MRAGFILVALFVVIAALAKGPLEADEVYLTSGGTLVTDIQTDATSGLRLALLEDASKIGLSVNEVIALDPQGRMVGKSPIGTALRIDCTSGPGCIVWDRSGNLAHAPAPAAPVLQIETPDGRLETSRMTSAIGDFGFDARPMTWREHLRVDLSVLRDYPLHALSAVLLWAIISRAMLGWLSLPRHPSVWPKGHRLLPVAVLIAAIPMALILYIIGCFYATIIPSSGLIIWAQAVAGILLAATLWTRSRRNT